MNKLMKINVIPAPHLAVTPAGKKRRKAARYFIGTET